MYSFLTPFFSIRSSIVVRDVIASPLFSDIVLIGIPSFCHSTYNILPCGPLNASTFFLARIFLIRSFSCFTFVIKKPPFVLMSNEFLKQFIYIWLSTVLPLTSFERRLSLFRIFVISELTVFCVSSIDVSSEIIIF